MRKKAFISAWLLAALLTVLLAAPGCNNDTAGVQPDPTPCSLSSLAPQAGAIFSSNDQANIRWEEQGDADSVRIELLQNGSRVGMLAASTENDGFFPWNAKVMDGVGGEFAIRITALDQDSCAAESGHFTINNTAACNIVLAALPDSLFVAGEILPITWESHDTMGFIRIELWHGHLNAVLVGTIAEHAPDNGSFSWTVDSFNDAEHRAVTDSSVYWLRIFDEDVAGCEDYSPDFTLIDPDLCVIDDYIVGAGPGAVLTAEETVTIGINVHDRSPGEFIKIRLYAGNIPVPGGYITPNGADIPADTSSYEWQVQDYGYVTGGNYFNVRVIKSDDEYCWGRTFNFAIR